MTWLDDMVKCLFVPVLQVILIVDGAQIVRVNFVVGIDHYPIAFLSLGAVLQICAVGAHGSGGGDQPVEKVIFHFYNSPLLILVEVAIVHFPGVFGQIIEFAKPVGVFLLKHFGRIKHIRLGVQMAFCVMALSNRTP